ncbi:MAG: DNA polymerase III subunit gamma/tau [Paludibacter sp.]|nr:DNA polymerase III subunit gamma/tau [Bacteroidales bacterium]MCM1069126.1 DNA polymerase III subunit gamma/tau [Prevotella sp.]MCM1353565.1 DNA polymerase III subunit gamma/tau [Bacteroides sp.]MCM1442726.1 DNA polymerase III subunit gamma/tau [Muribaculum sp.]MCM1481638.1 DNA polymerase III subunit gamma/tau [Paludibacter sp.]
MENYIVSARKYRPSTFESVVGQQNLTQTLRNAIATNHLAQAYLFCGPRGVGKTTCARIFAKTINCLHPTEEHEACNQCESCNAFNEQRSFNIHELDAASNNSVENIRMLIEQVRIPPQIGKYSVFIIDEVHMLSKDAFNALLKTLEEPPSYAVFILATTEKNKVIPTILSRCQVYDFSRITIDDTIRHLQYVAKNEGIQVSEDALNVVAQKADGGMRDALSIFDQLVSFCGNTITCKQALEILNVLDSDYYFQLIDNALDAKVGEALLLFNEVLTKGFDAQNFVVGLGAHVRNVLVSKNPETTVLLETSESIKQNYIRQAQRCPIPFIFRALDLINDCDINYRQAKNKRLTVELMLIKLCQLTSSLSANNVQTPLQSISVSPTATQTVASQGRQGATQPTTPRPQIQTQVTTPNSPSAQYNTTTKKLTATSHANAQPKIVSPVISIRPGATQAAHAIEKTDSVTESQEGEDKAHKPLRNKVFTQEEFERVWLRLPAAFPKEERLKATLQNAKLVFADNMNIQLTLNNVFQEEEVKKWLRHITDNVRNLLQNDYITFSTKVEEVKSKGVTTTAERYHYLMERNPELDNLRRVLKLQLY